MKLSFTPLSMKQLKKEFKNAKVVNKDKLISDNVVRLKLPLPIMAISKYYKDYDNLSLKYFQMMNFLIYYFKNIKIETKESKYILNHQLKKLVKNESSVFYNRLVNQIDTTFFDFRIPVSFMHGDFVPQNTIINDGKLYLIDLEYSSLEGSIIYDWWFFRRNMISNKKFVNKRDYQKFNAFLEDSLLKLEISMNQFDAFGHAMHAIIDLSRLETRDQSIKVLNHNLEQITLILSKQSP